MSRPTPNAKIVADEVMTAFRDIPPPERYIPEDFDPHGESEDLDYLDGKTWLEIAGDMTYMVRHTLDQFYFMERECLFYLLPGYMLGVLNHPPEVVGSVTQDLLELLHQYFGTVDGSPTYNRYAYICDRLTDQQKKAVARWLQLVLERDKMRSPELYATGARESIGRTPDPKSLERAFDGWKHWLEDQNPP